MIDERHKADLTDLSQNSRPERTMVRRIGLPSGRAVTGALLVTMAVVGMLVANRRAQDGPDTSYVVLTTRVAQGQRISATDLATRKLDLADDIAALVVTQLNEGVGGIALETLLPGQLLQTQAILGGAGSEPTDAEVFEVSLELDRSRALGGSIKPGERVDVVATINNGANACTSAVVRAARVARVSGGVSDGLSGRSGRVTVTLAIADPGDVLGAVFAIDEAEATLVRSTRAGASTMTGTFCADAHSATSDESGSEAAGGG